jgi:hypothetical protein
MSGATQKTDLKYKKYKKAIHIMTNSSYNAHNNPLFKKHQILPYDLFM